MFRHKPAPTIPQSPPVEPVDGFFFATPQRFLIFGNNRAIPTAFRPTLSTKRRDGFAAVLPCTSKNSSGWQFFALAHEEIRWLKPENRPTYLYYRYESLPLADLGNKIGLVSQNARVNIAHWLKRVSSGWRAA